MLENKFKRREKLLMSDTDSIDTDHLIGNSLEQKQVMSFVKKSQNLEHGADNDYVDIIDG